MNFDHTTQTISNVSTLSPNSLLTINSPEGIVLPIGNTIQRPSTTIGCERFNIDIGKLEIYDGVWANVATETFVTTSLPSTAIHLTGDATGSGVTGANTVVTLNTINANVGQFTKVTVNQKGLITSATTLGKSDITTALGYTPISGTTIGAGTVLQTIVSNIAPISGTSTIVDANVMPTTSMGTTILSMAIQPSATSSRVCFSGTFLCDNSNSFRYMWAFFYRNAVCIGVSSVNIQTHGHPQPIAFTFVDSPATTVPVTYSINVAGQSNTWYINQSSLGPLWAGAMALNTVSLQELS